MANAQNGHLTSQKSGNGSKFILQANAGPGFYLSNAGAPAFLKPELSRTHINVLGRLIWKPGHRINVAVESGATTFYSYRLTADNGTKGRVALRATPMLLEFAITLRKGFQLYAGPGMYLLRTDLAYADERVYSNKMSTGWMAAAAYEKSLSRRLQLGTEVKWLYASETVKGSLLIALTAGWQILGNAK